MEHFIGLTFGIFKLIVKNARETYGHDDSLPYNAEFDLYKNGELIGSGHAWNDGWGGPSNVSFNNMEYAAAREIENDITAYTKEHLQYKWEDYTMSLDFTNLVENLVYLSVDPKSPNCGHVFCERAFINYLNEN